MDNKKVCFVACVNNETMFEECQYYINHLEIPDGFSVEIIGIRDAHSITEGYNKAMQSSDAMYKVYIHQDIFITNKRMIYELINIFNSDDCIGMVGLIGAEKLSRDGVWWNSEKQIGMAYDTNGNQMNLITLAQPQAEVTDAQVIDGIFMATRYDLPFREDLFDGWHFYDLSQSMEFIRRGYRVVIPAVNKPWCIHDCGITHPDGDYEKYRRIFLKEYSEVVIGQ